MALNKPSRLRGASLIRRRKWVCDPHLFVFPLLTRGEMCRGRTAAGLANRRHRAFISVAVSDTAAAERKKEKRGAKSCRPKVAAAEVAETLTGNQKSAVCVRVCVCVCRLKKWLVGIYASPIALY